MPDELLHGSKRLLARRTAGDNNAVLRIHECAETHACESQFEVRLVAQTFS
jgi:hypothetical protein